jgi:hypothetical protein
MWDNHNMPRLARLDAPGVLRHVMGRGVERKKYVLGDVRKKGGRSCRKCFKNDL